MLLGCGGLKRLLVALIWVLGLVILVWGCACADFVVCFGLRM